MLMTAGATGVGGCAARPAAAEDVASPGGSSATLEREDVSATGPDTDLFCLTLLGVPPHDRRADVTGDIVIRSVSFAMKKYLQFPDVEKNLERLNQLLQRVHTIAEEAERRLITNERMLQQLGMLIDGMHRGHYMLDTFKYRALQEKREEEVSHFSASSVFNPAKRLCLFNNNYTKAVLFGSNNIKELQRMIATLEDTISDLKEFVLLVGSYPGR